MDRLRPFVLNTAPSFPIQPPESPISSGYSYGFSHQRDVQPETGPVASMPGGGPGEKPPRTIVLPPRSLQPEIHAMPRFPEWKSRIETGNWFEAAAKCSPVM